MEHNKDLTPFAQKLRKNMTKEEQKLWYQFLKNHPVQFNRQATCNRNLIPSRRMALYYAQLCFADVKNDKSFF